MEGREEFNPDFIPHRKIYVKCATDLNIKAKSIKLLKGNLGKRQNFLGY